MHNLHKIVIHGVVQIILVEKEQDSSLETVLLDRDILYIEVVK